MKTGKYLKSIITVTILLWLTGCNFGGDSFNYNKDVIIVSGTESNSMVKFVVEDTPATYIVTASATGKVQEDVTVSFAQDNLLLEAYNKANNTNYFPIPESAIQIEGLQGVIKAGNASSTGIRVKVVSTSEFKDGRTYVIPVTIKEVKGGSMDVLPASQTIFLRISRIINFNSLDISNPYFYGNAYFTKPVELPNYTYEIKCFINQWHSGSEPISRLSNFCPIDESVANLLRFGENGQDINSLQWVTPGGGIVSTTRFNTGQWYTVSLTFDGSVYRMYVNGVKDTELNGNKGTIFQRLELGMSWYDSGTPANSYPNRQRFLGRIAEIRLWDRALSTSELQIGLCGVDPQSEGLVAYWKLNEGEGPIFHDATGNGYDIDWNHSYQNDRELNKSTYVNWKLDDSNKCSN